MAHRGTLPLPFLAGVGLLAGLGADPRLSVEGNQVSLGRNLGVIWFRPLLRLGFVETSRELRASMEISNPNLLLPPGFRGAGG